MRRYLSNMPWLLASFAIVAITSATCLPMACQPFRRVSRLAIKPFRDCRADDEHLAPRCVLSVQQVFEGVPQVRVLEFESFPAEARRNASTPFQGE